LRVTDAALPFASFTRQAVGDFVETYQKQHQRRQAAAVLKNLFGIARYHGVVAIDEAAGLGLETTPPRDRIWADEEIARWHEAASSEDPHMSTAFLLLQYTAQRPSDRVRLWSILYRAQIGGSGWMSFVTKLGFEAVDAGPLRVSRLLEAYGMLWIDQALNRGRSRSFAFALIDRAPSGSRSE